MAASSVAVSENSRGRPIFGALVLFLAIPLRCYFYTIQSKKDESSAKLHTSETYGSEVTAERETDHVRQTGRKNRTRDRRQQRNWAGHSRVICKTRRLRLHHGTASAGTRQSGQEDRQPGEGNPCRRVESSGSRPPFRTDQAGKRPRGRAFRERRSSQVCAPRLHNRRILRRNFQHERQRRALHGPEGASVNS